MILHLVIYDTIPFKLQEIPDTAGGAVQGRQKMRARHRLHPCSKEEREIRRKQWSIFRKEEEFSAWGRCEVGKG